MSSSHGSHQNAPYKFWLQSDQNSKLSPLARKVQLSIRIRVCKWKWFSFIFAVRLNRLKIISIFVVQKLRLKSFSLTESNRCMSCSLFWIHYVYLHHKISVFLPLFQGFLSEHKKSKQEKMNFLLVGFILFLSSRVLLAGIKMGINVVCTSLLAGKHNWFS